MINPLETGNCGENVITAIDWFMTAYLLGIVKKHFLIFYSNSKANTSELLENLEGIFPRDYICM